MTLKRKLKLVLAGEMDKLHKGDIRKLVNYLKAQNKEIKRLSALKDAPTEIEIVDI